MTTDYDALVMELHAEPDCRTTQAKMIDWLQEFRGISEFRAKLEVEIELVAAVQARDMARAAAHLADGSPFRESVRVRVRFALGIGDDDGMLIVLTGGDELKSYVQACGYDGEKWHESHVVTLGARRVLRWVEEF